jgi:transposase
VRHGVSWGKARRAEKAFLAEWDASRPTRRPKHLGADEIYRGKMRDALLAVNRRLFRAYVLREQLDRLWTSATPQGVGNFVTAWLKALRWQRLPELEKFGRLLVDHLEGIAAYCFHRVRFGVVESLNTTIKAVLRRARGMKDDTMLLLKLKWATARPIRTSRGLAKFLHFDLYSNG